MNELDSSSGAIALQEDKERVAEVGIDRRTQGILLIVFAAFMSAVTSVLNRSLKNLNSSLVMFFHGVFGLGLALGGLVVYSIYTFEMVSIFGYSAEQYKMIMGACLLDTLGTFAQTIAF